MIFKSISFSKQYNNTEAENENYKTKHFKWMNFLWWYFMCDATKVKFSQRPQYFLESLHLIHEK